jgi:hypothetical protein
MVSIAVEGSKYRIVHATRLHELAEQRGGLMDTESIEYFGKVDQRYGSPPSDFPEGQRMYVFVRPRDDLTANSFRNDERYAGYAIGERTAKGGPRTYEHYASIWIPRALFNNLLVSRCTISKISLDVREQRRKKTAESSSRSIVFELDNVLFVDDHDDVKRELEVGEVS